GIKYAIMELISECYDIMHHGLGLTSEELEQVFKDWDSGDMKSFLLEITAIIFERKEAAKVYKTDPKTINVDKKEFIHQLKDALYFSTLVSYAQGLAMLTVASAELKMDIPLPEVVSVWRGGCIIRSAMLEMFKKAYQQNSNLKNLLLDKSIAEILQEKEP